MRICHIFSGGSITNDLEVIVADDDYVICADAGYRHALMLGIKPDCLIGDFDTLPLQDIPDDGLCILKYPKEKDDTDTMLAVKHAIDKGFKMLYIYDALGGRFDHTYANIQTLCYAYEHGAEAVIKDADNIITVQGSGIKSYPKLIGYYFSVFSLSDLSSGISIDGVKYPLDNAKLSSSNPLGVSNEIIADYASIMLKNGLLLIVFSKEYSQNPSDGI